MTITQLQPEIHHETMTLQTVSVHSCHFEFMPTIVWTNNYLLSWVLFHGSMFNLVQVTMCVCVHFLFCGVKWLSWVPTSTVYPVSMQLIYTCWGHTLRLSKKNKRITMISNDMMRTQASGTRNEACLGPTYTGLGRPASSTFSWKWWPQQVPLPTPGAPLLATWSPLEESTSMSLGKEVVAQVVREHRQVPGGHQIVGILY